ncbi:MAG: hypothetical protein HN350_04900 [Phycisphaerales bacterium]|jgi:hypothetical protein|nr:hypothetical protein [Phycisphaerales bacterium]
MMSYRMVIFLLVLCAATVASAKPPRLAKSAKPASDPQRALFDSISHDIKTRLRCVKYAKQAARADGAILESDRDPADVVLRRTAALLKHLSSVKKAPNLSGEKKALDALTQKSAKTPIKDAGARYALYIQGYELSKRVAFRNPLLDFERIIFMGRRMPATRHMCPQQYGFVGTPGGGVFVLDKAFSDKPKLRQVLGDTKIAKGRTKGKLLSSGAFEGFELDWDARTVYFAWTEAKNGKPQPYKPGDPWFPRAKFTYTSRGASYWAPESTYHIFKASIDPVSGAADAKTLAQITDGSCNDVDPCVLPNGRIAFISERRGGYGRCHGAQFPSYTLHGMMADGSDIIPFSYHETNEWHPSVTNEGMIIYTRWDYVDRDADIAHHPWICYPDGRDSRSYHGNYPENNPRVRPNQETHVRAIPGSHKFVAVASPHHGLFYGSMILLDQRVRDDRKCSQIKRITPTEPFAESEGSWSRYAYGSPWPLSEDFHICVHNPGKNGRFSGRHDLYLVDTFGNRIHLATLPDGLQSLDPIPLRPRKRPPVIPTRTQQARADQVSGASETLATISVMNVYESEFPMPKGVKIKSLRVIQVHPKATFHMFNPEVGLGKGALTRSILGTAPVAEDGSCHFEAPVGVPIYFQALDENGVAVHSMRSATYVHKGEQLVCIGCHEDKHKQINRPSRPIAMRKAPVKLTPEFPEVTQPLTFPRLVQPVLDKHCVKCHTKEKKAPDLSGKKISELGWSESYWSLAPFAWSLADNGGGACKRHSKLLPRGDGWQVNKRSYSLPGQLGARASKLYPMLLKGHKKLKLPPEDMRRITLWLDANSLFYGAYRDLKAQSAGKLVKPELN